MKYLHGFSLNSIAVGLAFSLGLVNQSLLARQLGTEAYGTLSLWVTTVMIAGLLVGEWFNRGATYTVGRLGDRGPAVRLGLRCGLAAVVLVPLALQAVGPAHLPLPGLSRFHVGLLAALIVLGVMQKAGEAILLGEDRIGLYSAVPVLFISLWLLGNLVVLKGLHLGSNGVLWSWLAAVGGTALAVWLMLVPGASVRDHLERQTVRDTASVGLRAAASAVLVLLLFRVNFYLVEAFLGAGSLGVFRVAVIFADMMQRVPNIAGVVLLPKVISGDDRAGQDVFSMQVALAVLAFSLVAAAVIFTVGKWMILLVFSAEYEGAFTPLVWLLPGLILAGAGSVLNTRLAGLGYPPATYVAPALALAANVALNLVLIPSRGLAGAALATSISYGIWVGLIAVAFARHLRRTGTDWRAAFAPPWDRS